MLTMELTTVPLWSFALTWMPSQDLLAHFDVQSLSLRSRMLSTLPLTSVMSCMGLNDAATNVPPVCPKSKMIVTPLIGFPLGSTAVAINVKVSEQASIVCFEAVKRIPLRMPLSALCVRGVAFTFPDHASYWGPVVACVWFF